jgi:hypothetical protein
VDVGALIQTQHGMIRRAIKLEKRSLDPVGKFDKLVQDNLGVRGGGALIRKRTTKVPNCLRTSRLIQRDNPRSKEEYS